MKHRKYSKTQQLLIPVLNQQQISASQAITNLTKYINIYVQSHREMEISASYCLHCYSEYEVHNRKKQPTDRKLNNLEFYGSREDMQMYSYKTEIEGNGGASPTALYVSLCSTKKFAAYLVQYAK